MEDFLDFLKEVFYIYLSSLIKIRFTLGFSLSCLGVVVERESLGFALFPPLLNFKLFQSTFSISNLLPLYLLFFLLLSILIVFLVYG